MENPKRWMLITGLLCIVCLPGGCGVSNFRHQVGPVERSMDFEGAGEFEAKIPNGKIAIYGWDNTTVSLSATICARAGSPARARELAEATKIELKRFGRKIFVQYVLLPSRGNNEHVRADMTIYLPFDAAAKASSDYGDISVAEIKGRVEIKSGYGDITLSKSGGSVDCRTSYGDISISEAQGPVDCQTSYGDILLTTLFSSAKCRTSYGDIIVKQAHGMLDCHTSYGDITVSLGPGDWKGQKLNLDTSYGDVQVNVVTDQKP